MKPSRLSTTLLPAALGVAVAFASVPLLGYTSAIVAPAGLFAYFKSHGMPGFGLLLWEVFIVEGLAVGVLTVLVLLGLFRLLRGARLPIAGSFVAGVLVARYFILPLAFGFPVDLSFQREWWAIGLEVSLVLAVVVAWAAAVALRMTPRST